MCIILASAEAFTLYILSKMAERYQGKTYGTLVRKALGKKLSAGEKSPPRGSDLLRDIYCK